MEGPGCFFFLFFFIVFIVSTGTRARMQPKLWRQQNPNNYATPPHRKKPVLPRPYGMGPTAHPDLRNPSLPAQSSKTLAAASRPIRQIERNLSTKARQESIRKTLQRPPKTKESPKARKEKIDVTTGTPGRTG